MANLGYISEVQLPGASGTYKIKDAEARELIQALEDYTDYLGVTTTELTDGSTTNPVTIGGKSVTAKKGNIVNYGSKEFIFNGEEWQEFGDMSALKALAFKDSATGSFVPNVNKTGTVTAKSATLSATAIPLTLSTTAVTGATSFKAVGNPTTGKAAVTVSYSKATSGTVTVNSSATFSGTIAGAVTGVTGGTGTKNTASTFSLSESTDGVAVVTGIPSTTTVTGGAATVGSSTVYGLAASTTKYMTGAEELNKVSTTVLTSVTASTNANAFDASVTGEVLTFTATAGTVDTASDGSTSVLSATTTITTGSSATASSYVVGKSGATQFTQPTVTIGAPTTKKYKVSVPANTYITGITEVTATTDDIAISVSGAAVTTSAVAITNTAADATGTTNANVVTGIDTTTLYGTVNAYAGGSHTHEINDTIVVSGATTNVTVS